MYPVFLSSSSARSGRIKIKQTHLWSRLLLFLIFSKFLVVEANHKHFCFNSLQERDAEEEVVPDSIGMEDVFDPTNSNVTNCEYKPEQDHTYVVEIMPVKYKDDYLFGWFHLKVVGVDRFFRMRWTLMQAQTTGNEVVPGEFFRGIEMENSTSCRTQHIGAIKVDPPFAWFSKKNYVPCSFVADPNPTVSYGFSLVVYSRPDLGPTEMHLNYRLTFPICGFYNERSVGLYFRTYIMDSNNDPVRCESNSYPRQGYVFFKDYVGGAHDPPPPKNAALDCTRSLLDLQKNNAADLPKWINRTEEPHAIPNETFHDEHSRCREEALRAEAEIGRVRWFGRCQYYNSSSPTLNSSKWALGFERQHYCETMDNPYYSNLPDQIDVRPDSKPLNKTGADSCGRCNKTLLKMKAHRYKTRGTPVNSMIGLRVYSYRQNHAIFMVIVSLFFTPVSHFVARFYKETFLASRILSFHVWYSIHVNTSIFTLLGLIAAQVAAVSARLCFFGYSKTLMAKLHVFVGWTNIGLFVITLLLYDLRCRSPIGRSLSICLHCLGGSLFSILNTVLIVSSFFIPGSPSTRHDPHSNKAHLVFELFFIPFGFWVAFDFGISILMNCCLQISDVKEKSKKKRKWVCFPFFGVPIPLRRPYAYQDLWGFRIRKMILFAYLVLSFIVTGGLLALLLTNPTKGRSFGLMDETHNEKGE